MIRFHISTIAFTALLGGCATGSIKLGEGGIDTAGGTDVGGTIIDGGGTTSTTSDGDGGAADAGATDAGATDAGATDAGATDAGATDAGATDAGATDGGGTSTDWTGIYSGSIDISATDSWSSYDLGNCDTTLIVDPSHSLTGAALCDASGMGGTTKVPIEGTVSDDGHIDATANLGLGWGSTAPLDVSGDIGTDGLMSLVIYGEVDVGWDTATVEGSGELFRE